MDEGNADKPDLLSQKVRHRLFSAGLCGWVLTMGKVLFRSVTCLMRMHTSYFASSFLA